MNFIIKKQKQWKTKLTAYILLALSHTSTIEAAVIVVDIADTNIHQFTTQLGNHPTINYGDSGEFRLVGGGFIFTNGVEIGSNASGEAFSQAGGAISIDSESSFKNYGASGNFFAGATRGINYARFTGNQSTKRYYIVAEFDFGLDSDPSDDVITRYAYEDTDPNLFYLNGAANPNFPPTTLTIAEAEAAFAASQVPEPSSSALLGLGGLGLLLRRHR